MMSSYEVVPSKTPVKVLTKFPPILQNAFSHHHVVRFPSHKEGKVSNMPINKRKRKDLTEDERKMVISFLLESSTMVDGEAVLAFGARTAAAKKIGCDPTTIKHVLDHHRSTCYKRRPKQKTTAAQDQIGIGRAIGQCRTGCN